ncbi:hypothetical protein [Paenibacillus turpanensis]|uniref:hypothetical protein n=1 Tax=Paenibacillus turpanensis TaxID=2689078 RepID=UPI00140929C4|nr:hypothetical protein [Paenibacillus turpanensis]
MIIWKWCRTIAAAALITAGCGGFIASTGQAAETTTAAISISAETEPSVLDHNVRHWVADLAGKPGFEKWAGASWSSAPLGAGQHGFVVHIYNGDAVVGYMIVGASESGGEYRLLEYGIGDHPLFSLQTLHQSLMQLGLIPEHHSYERVYSDGLHAYWRVDTAEGSLWLDAKTGEQLPVPKEWSPSAAQLPYTNAERRVTVLHQQLKEPFEPTDHIGWLEAEPEPSLSVHELDDPASHYVYQSSLFEGNLIYPFAVTGAHSWDSDLIYTAIEHNGSRFLPQQLLHSAGAFFRWEGEQ